MEATCHRVSAQPCTRMCQEWSRAASRSESEETRRRGKASCRRVSAQPAALPPCTILVPGPCVSRVLSSYPHKTRISLHSFVLVLPAVESGDRSRLAGSMVPRSVLRVR